MHRRLRRDIEAEVISEYLHAGLADAIRDSLKSLFSERRLPDNPYYYLASALGAYVDQSSLWSETDMAIVCAMDSDGGLEVADAAAKLCRLAACAGGVLGLPHVLRCVSREGAKVVHDVLTNSLPDSFFPGPTPFSSRRPGYTVQVLSSVQGSTVMWHPQWLEFPELVVRCDVVVRGPRLDEALGLLADLLASDLQDLEAVPVYFVEGIRMVEPLATRNVATAAADTSGTLAGVASGAAAGPGGGGFGGSSGGGGALWTLPDMLLRPEDFRRALAREVLSGKQAVMAGVVMLEAPRDAAHLAEYAARFESCVKTYSFHFWETPGPAAAAATAAAAAAAGPAAGGLPAPFLRPQKGAAGAAGGGSSRPASLRAQVAHYGSTPYEALCEGYFLDPAALKAYMALHAHPAGTSGGGGGGSGGGGSGGARAHAPAPYAREALEAQATQLSNLIEVDMVRGATMDGFRRLLLLVLMQDPVLLQAGPLHPGMLLSLEELLLTRAPTTQAEMLVTTSVNLVRILNSGAADIQAIVRELSALMLVVQQWPRRRGACLDQARAQLAAAGAAATGGDAGPAAGLEAAAAGRPRSAGVASSVAWAGDADAAAGGEAGAGGAEDARRHAGAMLAWLGDHANLEARVVAQLASIKPRVAAATGGVFAGISTILGQLLAQLPDAAPDSADACAATLQAAQQPMEELQQLLAAAALSLADALLDRCRDVMWALQRFGIRLVDSVMARAALVNDGADLPPEWVLDVEAVTEAQVRAGAVAERVASEGVMLQYAVDTRLDCCLRDMYAAVTRPPLPRNPYPLLLHTLRAYAARLELWQEDQQGLAARLLNQLALLSPPAFIYAATPPPGSGRRRGLAGAGAFGRSGSGGGGAGDADEEDSAVYGCYAAVALCDCRALHALAGSLGPLLAQRSWQHGSYCADVVPALAGDACLSGALSLDRGDELLAAAADARQVDQAAAGGHGQGGCRSPYEHPHFFRVVLEEHHQVEGPQLAAAAAMFVQGAAEYMLELHHKSQHIVHQVVVGAEAFELPQLLQPAGRQVFVSLLTTAAQRAASQWPATYGDRCLAVIHLLAVVKEGLYVQVLKRLHFAFDSSLGLSHDTTSTAAAAAHRRFAAPTQSVLPVGGSLTDPEAPQSVAATAAAAAAAAARGGVSSGAAFGARHLQLQAEEAEAREPHWDAGVYQRVFVTEAAARAWHEWNSARGDPAQPFHREHLQRSVQQQAHELEAQGSLLDAQKLLLTAASAMQDGAAMCTLSRAMRSAAQELRCLQDMSAVLQLLLAPELPPAHRAKVDGERVRRLLLTYCRRLRRALTSPRYCYFSGFAAAAPQLIGELRDHVLSSFRLDARRASVMQQLNLWTLACELSVAASVRDCLGGGGGSSGKGPPQRGAA